MQAADPLLLWPCSAQLIQPHQQAQTQMQAPPHAHMHNGFVGPGSPRLQPGSPHVGSPHLSSPLVAGPLQQHLQLQGAEQPSSPGRSQSSRSSSGSQGAPQGEAVLGLVTNHDLDDPMASTAAMSGCAISLQATALALEPQFSGCCWVAAGRGCAGACMSCCSQQGI